MTGASFPSASDPWEAAAGRVPTAFGDAEWGLGGGGVRRDTGAGSAGAVAFVGPLRGWAGILQEASCLDAVAYRLRAQVEDGRSAFQELEGKLAVAQSREAAADARVAEEKLSDLIARCKRDAIERERTLGELKAAQEQREVEAKAKEEAEVVAAQLAVEVAQLKKGVEGLQTLVSTREDEA